MQNSEKYNIIIWRNTTGCDRRFFAVPPVANTFQQDTGELCFKSLIWKKTFPHHVMEPVKGHDTHSTLSEVKKTKLSFFLFFLIFCFFDF